MGSAASLRLWPRVETDLLIFKRFMLNSSVVCEIGLSMCYICIVKFLIYLISYFVLPISVNKDVCKTHTKLDPALQWA